LTLRPAVASIRARHDFARSLPAAGLVHEARKGAQLRLLLIAWMKAQIDCDLGREGIERGIAGEAKM
jgi:hypothetical protein